MDKKEDKSGTPGEIPATLSQAQKDMRRDVELARRVQKTLEKNRPINS